MTAFPVTAFAASTSAMLWGGCFVGVLTAASVSDVRTRRIPNALVALLALLGIVFGLVALGPAAGLARAFVGLGVGFALWIPFYAMGMLGAGDVKLFAAGCCWLAPSQVFVAALLTALLGGVLSVAGLVLAHGLGLTTFRITHAVRAPKMLATRLAIPAGRPTLPYGLAIAAGLAATGWIPQMSRLIGKQ